MAASAKTSSACEKTISFNITAKVINCLLGSESMDCTFKFGDKKIKVHRKLLSAFSSVFADRFATRWANNFDPIPIVDASYENYSTFLDFFYKGEIKLTVHNVMAILFLASKFNVQEMVSSCSTYASGHLYITNVVEYYSMAIRLNEEHLLLKCTEFITNNTEDVLKSRKFLRCDRGMLKRILQMEKPCKEAVVIHACFEWAKEKCHQKSLDISQPTNLRAQLSDCFGLIRFKKMESHEFAKFFETFKEMFSSEESTSIFMHFMQAQQQQPCSTGARYIQLDNPAKPNEIVFNFDQDASTMSRSTKIQFVLDRPLMLKAITFSQPRGNSGSYLCLNAAVEISKQNGKALLNFSTKTIGKEYYRLVLPKLLFIPQNKMTTIEIDLAKMPYGITMITHKIQSTQRNSVEISFPPLSPSSFVSELVFTRPLMEKRKRMLSESEYSKHRKMDGGENQET